MSFEATNGLKIMTIFKTISRSSIILEFESISLAETLLNFLLFIALVNFLLFIAKALRHIRTNLKYFTDNYDYQRMTINRDTTSTEIFLSCVAYPFPAKLIRRIRRSHKRVVAHWKHNDVTGSHLIFRGQICFPSFRVRWSTLIWNIKTFVVGAKAMLWSSWNVTTRYPRSFNVSWFDIYVYMYIYIYIHWPFFSRFRFTIRINWKCWNNVSSRSGDF